MKQKKPWGGRFTKQTASSVESFTESVSFDWRLYQYDIEGSIAHATMLAKCKLITEKEKDAIVKGLKEILAEIEAEKFEFKKSLEDVHMNIESALIERIGEAGKKLHTARSRNDQVALDLRLWTRNQTRETIGLLAALQKEFVRKGKAVFGLIMPGFTHLQHAQPVLVSHYLLAYVEMLERDKTRLQDCLARLNKSPLGACALAGTTLPTDPAFTAKLLDFDGVYENSMDAVSDRDFCVEYAFCLSLVAVHLSRLCEEWIIWCNDEVKFIEISDAYCTGSSIMPQKKNPDVLELIRGKCGRAFGHLTSLLTLLKGLPLSYNRDMQEDKMAIFDASDTVQTSLSVLTELVANTNFHGERMMLACEKGFIDATALAEYLVKKGVPFRMAHEIVGKIVRECIRVQCRLMDLRLESFKAFSSVIEKDVYKVLGVENCIKNYKSHGSTAPGFVKKRIAYWEKKLSKG
ncbi:MAG: argininosuccinate lyase [Candidatus Brocadia sp. AMX2]|uniref:Argininosuccinate lyase n=1 Tax=Candidatus Brocadia sinica JPN1 TaxID=1197129 RepID=A0ABQ0JTH0_9BACT|nr:MULTISPECIES: argininosuccinate lyase [Brocadia]KXK30666.1 MAG: argininosuccinate lyase [Candidatus Brocadia sinica]MBC6931948.1 argininosuccinate lyase [Candidatus Brocadia sp.]MBL1168287.1 argininosuccinate lyase [Candidatus Brocadia sp. AMX1]KAA0243452.1 MAG: argininosuccinate lyase [Candidatus Brocadia sp. AMX2]MCE7866166.1 argininosuccinate lyase [Candidatus Brocadia sp. AMX2]